LVLDDIMNFALRGKFVDSETKLLSAPSAHAGSNLPRKVCRRGKEGVGGREKIDPEKQGKRKKISSNQSRMNLSSIIARDASKGLFGSVVAVAFQIAFRAKMHVNDVFFIF